MHFAVLIKKKKKIFLRKGGHYVEPQGRGEFMEEGGGKQVQVDASDWHSKEVRGPHGKLIMLTKQVQLICMCLRVK